MNSKHDPNEWGIDTEEEELISKSELKRIAEHKQQLGKALTELSADKLSTISLPPNLVDAINDYKRMSSNGAKKRQLQFIGKLMRGFDVNDVETALNRFNQQDHLKAAHLHTLERWRERLLSPEGDRALTELLDQHPNLSAQTIRQLIRNAKKEASNQKPPKSFRELFRYLSASISSE